MTKNVSVYLFGLLCLLNLQGCGSSSGAKEKPAADKIPVAVEVVSPDLGDELGGRDPLEGFNRSMYGVNKFGHRYVLRPVVSFWGSIMPRHVVDCFNRFAENLAFPRRMFSSFLQAEFSNGGIVFVRFLTNTTVGVAGFYDPAWNWFKLEAQDEDFGQAFASWGIGSGAYLHLPGAGPCNIRDGVGKIFDYAFDPKTYIYGGQGFTQLNNGTARFREIDNFLRAMGDPYEMSKRLYCVERYLKINDYDRWKRFQEEQRRLMEDEVKTETGTVKLSRDEAVEVVGFESQGAAVDTLRVGQLSIAGDRSSMWTDVSLWNSDFYNKGSIRSVRVREGKSSMSYKVWLRKDRTAPLAVLLPGTGGHYVSSESAALGEVLYRHGFAVAVLSNALNWEFMETAASVKVPGYAPRDAMDVRHAIAKVVEDLERNKDCRFSAKMLAGYSLGGMHALFIADHERGLPPDKRIGFGRYVAINPPVDLLYSIDAVDAYAGGWRKWSSEQIFHRGSIAASKYMRIRGGQHEPLGGELAGDSNGNGNGDSGANVDALPFSPTEAKVLIGYSFKITLSEILLTINRQYNMGILQHPYKWGNRTGFYQEADQFTFRKYVDTFVKQYYSEEYKRQVSIEELGSKSSLYTLEKTLAADNGVYVLHSANDFLSNGAQLDWLRKTMGERCTVYGGGGHLGILSFKQAQDRFAEIAGVLLPAVPANDHDSR